MEKEVFIKDGKKKMSKKEWKSNCDCNCLCNCSKTPEHILAIDFDLTICMSDYPKLGQQRFNAGYIIRKLYDEGFGIVINTCREGHALSDAMHWLKEHNIPYHYVNCNFPHLIERYKADCRKISADMYIDDKGVDPLPEWDEIYTKIHEKFPVKVIKKKEL